MCLTILAPAGHPLRRALDYIVGHQIALRQDASTMFPGCLRVAEGLDGSHGEEVALNKSTQLWFQVFMDRRCKDALAAAITQGCCPLLTSACRPVCVCRPSPDSTRMYEKYKYLSNKVMVKLHRYILLLCPAHLARARCRALQVEVPRYRSQWLRCYSLASPPHRPFMRPLCPSDLQFFTMLER